jgi:hypothetical protein
MSYQDGWQHLYSLTPSDSKPLLVTPGDYMVEDVALSPDRKYFVFSANTGRDSDDVDRRHLYKVAIDRPAVQALSSGSGLE